MSDTILKLSQAVAGAVDVLPVGLTAKVEVVVSVDAFDLMDYLAKCYGASECELIEVSNDTKLEIDISEICETVMDSLDEEGRWVLTDGIQQGSIDGFKLHRVMAMAHLDGHLPKAKYIVSVCW
jgi:hypothetical protein